MIAPRTSYHLAVGAIGLLITLALAVSSTLAALADPGLSETGQWLEANLPEYVEGCDTLFCDGTSRAYHSHGCFIDITSDDTESANDTGLLSHGRYYVIEVHPRTGLNLYDPNESRQSTNSIDPDTHVGKSHSRKVLDLRSIDLSRVQIDSWTLSAEPIEHSAGLTFRLAGTKQINFATVDGELALRLRAALLHAARLCGATKDAF